MGENIAKVFVYDFSIVQKENLKFVKSVKIDYYALNHGKGTGAALFDTFNKMFNLMPNLKKLELDSRTFWEHPTQLKAPWTQLEQVVLNRIEPTRSTFEAILNGASSTFRLVLRKCNIMTIPNLTKDLGNNFKHLNFNDTAPTYLIKLLDMIFECSNDGLGLISFSWINWRLFDFNFGKFFNALAKHHLKKFAIANRFITNENCIQLAKALPQVTHWRIGGPLIIKDGIYNVLQHGSKNIDTLDLGDAFNINHLHQLPLELMKNLQELTLFYRLKFYRIEEFAKLKQNLFRLKRLILVFPTDEVLDKRIVGKIGRLSGITLYTQVMIKFPTTDIDIVYSKEKERYDPSHHYKPPMIGEEFATAEQLSITLRSGAEGCFTYDGQGRLLCFEQRPYAGDVGIDDNLFFTFKIPLT